MEELLNTKTIMTLMLAAGGASGIFALLKDAPAKIWKLIEHKIVFSVTIYKHDKIYDFFEEWFFENHNDKFTNVQMVSPNDSAPSDSNTKSPKDLSFSQKEGYFFIRHAKSILYISKGKIDRKDSNKDKPFLDYYIIRGINRSAVKSLIQMIYSKILKTEKVSIYSSTPYGDWITQSEVQPKTFKNIIIAEDLQTELVADVDEFLESEDWYVERGIPYNRGYLFHGIPGNGKTSMAIALADKYDKSVYVLDLSSLTGDGALRCAFRNIPSCGVMVIEEVDTIFIKRKAENEIFPITFGCLLNCIDGVFQKHGIIVIMTTNHKELLDGALIREGRVDLDIEIPNPTKACVERYLSSFYSEKIVLDNYELNLPMVNIQGMCIRNKKDSKPVIYQLSKLNKFKQLSA